jgi:hypothetical protein
VAGQNTADLARQRLLDTPPGECRPIHRGDSRRRAIGACLPRIPGLDLVVVTAMTATHHCRNPPAEAATAAMGTAAQCAPIEPKSPPWLFLASPGAMCSNDRGGHIVESDPHQADKRTVHRHVGAAVALSSPQG